MEIFAFVVRKRIEFHPLSDSKTGSMENFTNQSDHSDRSKDDLSAQCLIFKLINLLGLLDKFGYIENSKKMKFILIDIYIYIDYYIS